MTNLRSVVIPRKPELTYNAQFLDYARHVGFSIHACNPGKANEKGRVERVIRDARGFVGTTAFTDLADLNKKADLWRKERNERIHRATGTTPIEALAEEPLLPLPALPYRPYRLMPASVSVTAFVTFEITATPFPPTMQAFTPRSSRTPIIWRSLLATGRWPTMRDPLHETRR